MPSDAETRVASHEELCGVLPESVREEIYEDADAVFTVIDEDGDGSITVTELTNHLSKAGYNDKAIETVFSKLDADSDGELTKEELRAGFLNFAPLREAPGMGAYNAKFIDQRAAQPAIRDLTVALSTDRVATLDRELSDIDAQLRALKEERARKLAERRENLNLYDEVRFEVSGTQANGPVLATLAATATVGLLWKYLVAIASLYEIDISVYSDRVLWLQDSVALLQTAPGGFLADYQVAHPHPHPHPLTLTLTPTPTLPGPLLLLPRRRPGGGDARAAADDGVHELLLVRHRRPRRAARRGPLARRPARPRPLRAQRRARLRPARPARLRLDPAA